MIISQRTTDIFSQLNVCLKAHHQSFQTHFESDSWDTFADLKVNQESEKVKSEIEIQILVRNF